MSVENMPGDDRIREDVRTYTKPRPEIIIRLPPWSPTLVNKFGEDRDRVES